MFDDVHVEKLKVAAPKAVMQFLQLHGAAMPCDFQTKDLDSVMAHYTILANGQMRMHIIQIAALGASMHVPCKVNWVMIGWCAPTSSLLVLASSLLNIKQVWDAMNQMKKCSC